MPRQWKIDQFIKEMDLWLLSRENRLRLVDDSLEKIKAATAPNATLTELAAPPLNSLAV
jgi:hypothetical protein